jgi:hypothetical protein
MSIYSSPDRKTFELIPHSEMQKVLKTSEGAAALQSN